MDPVHELTVERVTGTWRCPTILWELRIVVQLVVRLDLGSREGCTHTYHRYCRDYYKKSQRNDKEVPPTLHISLSVHAAFRYDC